LEGESFSAKLRREQTVTLDELCRILLPVVAAVAAAHAAGVVHRDLKPENIFVARGRGGRTVKVLDFGLAKITGEGQLLQTGNVTRTGALLGTPSYMAPEQILGDRNIDHRADLWALGVIIYRALSGRRPVEGRTLGQMLKAITHSAIVPLEALVPSVPPPL